MAFAGWSPEPGRRLSRDIRPAAAGLLLGACVLNQLATLPGHLWFLLPFAIAVIADLLWRRHYPIFGLLAGLAFGLWYGAWQADYRLQAQLPASEHGELRWIEGHVSGLPETRQAQAGQVTRFSFLPRKNDLRQIRVAWYGAEAAPRTGQCWQLQLRLRSPRGSMNPGGLDYEGWLFRQGIGATATVKDARRCAPDAFRPMQQLREQTTESLRHALDEHPMQPFVLGLVTGERSGIDSEQWRVLRRTGVSHLLAISGLHIGLIAGFLFLLVHFAWSRIGRLALRMPALHAAAVTAALGGFFYAGLAGFSLPTQRALIMLLLALAALVMGRRLQSSRLLAWALVIVLLLDPFAVAAAGFWLSFGAVAWILYVLRSRLGMPGTVQGWLMLQLVLACTLLPLTLLWFHEGSWLAPFVNLLLIPLFFILVPLLLLAAVALLCLPGGAGWLLQLPVEVLEWVWRGLQLAELWVGALAPAAPVGLLAAALAVAGCVWLFAPRGWPARWLGLLLAVPLLLAAFIPRPPDIANGDVEVSFLDVGQGMSVVLQTRSHVLVYDAGPAYAGGFDAGAMVVVPFLRRQGIRKVDVYLQSHGDLDHRGGSASLRGEIPIAREIGTLSGDRCLRGEQWRWDQVDFEILHPDKQPWRGNNASCVLRVSAGPHALLLTGDIEDAAELRLLRVEGDRLRAEVLSVPHHGSASSSTIGLLNHSRPRLAVVSAGWRNRWELPRETVVRRYTARGIELLNTADSGAVMLRLSRQHGVQNLIHYRQDARRFWHAP